MYNESEGQGDVPAFKAGDVYEFFAGKESSHNPQLYTPRNNQGSCHYLPIKGFSEYFELVKQ